MAETKTLTRWMVVIFEYGDWTDTWDAKLHADKKDAVDEWAQACGAGYVAEVARVTFSVLSPLSKKEDTE